jgi:Tannase and feruloyl esterase
MRGMNARILAGVAIACVVVFSSPAEPPVFAAAEQADCASLTKLELPDVKVTEAVTVPAPASGTVRVAHCRVNGVIGKEIHFTLLLPDTWNHKFMMGGGGGFVQGIDNQAIASASAGYATVGTDTGHQGTTVDASWALNNPERQLNFGYLAVHRVTEVSKAILRAHYGSNETRSYFNGCSNGGRQGLMEAQRYPDDYDGIISGAPAADFTGLGAQFIKDQQTVFPDSTNRTTSVLPNDLLKSVEAQILEKCDAIDGVKDGLMEDPRACKADVSTLMGLTEGQKAALKRIYGETRTKDGVIYPAQPFGSEGDNAGWPLWIAGANPLLMMSQTETSRKTPNLRFGFGTELFKNFIFSNSEWDYSRYDFADFRKTTAKVAAILNATDPNLDKFKSSGGKLVIWHGWSDPALSALGTVKYYEQVVARDKKATDFVRMFMLPGVLHCFGGPGPDQADWAAVIDGWVEKGQAPARVVATKRTAGVVARTRPLCAYPKHAVYSGTGSIDDDANFVCK